jgi:glycosyltransferase involved in cell wall biosynthesis
MNYAGIPESNKPVLVSVVISVYNFNAYPIRGIETTLDQSYTDFEFIIVDDGSDQETKGILGKYTERDSRIKLLTNNGNLKLASSLNRGIRFAKGEYVARADANIDYHRQRLEKQLDFMENHPDIDILGSNFLWATEGKIEQKLIKLPETHLRIVRALSKGNCICHPSVFLRKDRLMPFGPYKEGFGKGQDYNLWMRARKKLSFHNLQQPLLVKWHRSNPWKGRLVEYFFNDIQIRIIGLKTSPNPMKDILYFPRCIKYFLQI